MRSRYLYLAAAVGFLVGLVLELRPPHNTYAAVLDAIVAAIFLLLGCMPQKPRLKPPAGKQN